MEGGKRVEDRKRVRDGGRDKGVRDGERDEGVRDGGRDGGKKPFSLCGLVIMPPICVLIVPPSLASLCPPSMSSSFDHCASLSFCRRTSLACVGIHLWGVCVVWVVSFIMWVVVGIGRRVEGGVGLAVVHQAYDDER